MRWRMFAFGTSRHFAALQNLFTIGVTADNGGFWPAMVCQLLTRSVPDRQARAG
jgi:hypothetical protein